MAQLEFLWRDEAGLRAELERLTGRRLTLALTDNTSTMMSMKRDKASGTVHVRLHRMFLGANPKVVRALAVWLKSVKAPKSGRLLQEFINENTHRIQAKSQARIRVSTRGARFDLSAIFDAFNREYFDGAVTARITWGKMPPLKRRRSIRFGSYYAAEDLIRIHPLLDRDFVPAYFVRYIVFHEMLHAFLKVDETSPGGRRRVHTREFKQRERACPDYARAVAWPERPSNLRKLLGRA